MNQLTLRLQPHGPAYLPGEHLAGTVRWQFDRPEPRLLVSLVWNTSGIGTEDVAVVRQITVPVTQPGGEQAFDFDLPNGPYSFVSKLVTLAWHIEAVAEANNANAVQDFILSPTAEPVNLLDERVGPNAVARRG